MAEQPKCRPSTCKRPGEIPGNGTKLDPGEEPMDTEDPSAIISEHVKKMKVSDFNEDSSKLLVKLFFKLNQKYNFN